MILLEDGPAAGLTVNPSMLSAGREIWIVTMPSPPVFPVSVADSVKTIKTRRAVYRLADE